MSFALITGASGGIGLAFARALASQKHDVLLVARSADKLQGICQELTHQFKVQADYLSLDLSRMDAALEVEQWLKQKNYGIDILINNAGFGSWGNINDLSREELNQMMQLNMLTLA
ncbi:MAG TPA: SDR family NAD(P)-dependent oxidoreductase, partial [Cyclobacteriaceae bacterium]|nr:SDR family NAD(P)-dependent oxidoreductase [Cyclobacteriaceae bacterium]